MTIPADFYERPGNYFKVCAEPCSECLFSAGRLVDAETRARIIENCLTTEAPHPLDLSQTIAGTFFICHQHSWNVPEDWDDWDGDLPDALVVCCRRFYDLYGDRLLTIRLARMLDGVVFVDQQGNPVEVERI